MPPQACSWSRNSHVSLCGPCEGLPANKHGTWRGDPFKSGFPHLWTKSVRPQPLWQGDNGTFFRAHHLMFSFSWPQCPGPGASNEARQRSNTKKEMTLDYKETFLFGPRACTILLYMALSGMCGQLCTKCEPTINLPASRCLSSKIVPGFPLVPNAGINRFTQVMPGLPKVSVWNEQFQPRIQKFLHSWSLSCNEKKGRKEIELTSCPIHFDLQGRKFW